MASLQAMAAAQDAERESWERLRTEVRERRNERGLTVAQLAEAIGSSATTLKTALGMRRPPSQRLRGRLVEWLKTTAPEVVPAEEPFCPRTRRGAGTARSAANGAACGGADHATA
jgi:transcriptional regulator with XRE-family HTH domain